MLGQDELTPRQRHERFIEFADALDVLLRFEPPGSGGVSFDGEWYTAKHARMVGSPAQQPRMPLLIAGNGPKTIRYAAERGDGWITTGGQHGGAGRVVGRCRTASLARFDDAYAASGRTDDVARILSLDDETFYSLSSVATYEDAVNHAASLGFTDVVAHWPREDGIYAGEESVLEAVAELMRR